MKPLHYLKALFFPSRFRKKLQQAIQPSPHHSLESLKKNYHYFYHLYSKLPPNQKRKHFSSLIKLQKTIESSLIAENQLQFLLETTPKLTNLKKQKQHYFKINQLHHQLPFKTQQKYHQQILHLREQLESKL